MLTGPPDERAEVVKEFKMGRLDLRESSLLSSLLITSHFFSQHRNDFIK